MFKYAWLGSKVKYIKCVIPALFWNGDAERSGRGRGLKVGGSVSAQPASRGVNRADRPGRRMVSRAWRLRAHEGYVCMRSGSRSPLSLSLSSLQNKKSECVKVVVRCRPMVEEEIAANYNRYYYRYNYAVILKNVKIVSPS